MKKLFYLGLTALMMLFAMPGVVRAQDGGDDDTPKVQISLSATTWDGTTADAMPKFTVTAPDGITIGTEAGQIAVKVNFFRMSPETEFDQFIVSDGETTMANPDGKLTEGVWMLSYALVKGDDQNTDYLDADVDVAESDMKLTVGNVSASTVYAQITFMPVQWQIGSEDGIMFMCGLSDQTMSMGTEEENVALLVTFTNGETVKKHLFTEMYGEFNPSTDAGLTAGTWALSYKFGKGNSTVENFEELDNILPMEDAPASLTILPGEEEPDPEIELIITTSGLVGKNWPVGLQMESENAEVQYGPVTVYYTLDGTTTPSKADYTEGGAIKKVTSLGYDEDNGWDYMRVRFTENCTFKAKAYVNYKGKEIASDEIEQDIVVFDGVPTPQAADFSVPAGNVASGTTLYLTLPEVELPGMGGGIGGGPLTYEGNKVACSAFYTLDGSEPSVWDATVGFMEEMQKENYDYEPATLQYDRAGIAIEGEVGAQITVKVVYAVADPAGQGMSYFPSDVASVTYTIAAGIPAPEIDPFSGEVSVGDKVYITSNDADEIYYSVNVEETLTVANGTKLEGNYIEITDQMAQGGSVKIQALGVKNGEDGADDVVSAVATANLTIKAPVAITFDPANGAEVEVGDEITLTSSREVQDMLYRWYATEAAAEEEWDDEGAEYYSEGKPTVQAGKPVLKVRYAEMGANATSDNAFIAVYTIKAGETPVDPDKIPAPQFMTDSYGQSHYAKATDKVRLVQDDCDSMFYAIIPEEDEDMGGFFRSAEPTFVKYDSAVSLADVETLKVTFKAFAMKEGKSSDTVEFTYTMIEKIDAYLVFKAFTGKNYPLGFTVYSENMDDIFDKDFMVYYTLDGVTEPSMEAYFAQQGDTIKYAAQIQYEDHLEIAYCELTQDTTVTAKAYVMLDADAEVVLEVPVESHRVTVNSIDAPTFSVADNQEYTDTIKVAINVPEGIEGAETFIFYTLDGSEPLWGRMINNQDLADSVIFEYWPGEDTIRIARNTTLKAIVYQQSGYGPMATVYGSDIATARYKFATELRFNPASGETVTEGKKVSITADNDVDIFYMMFESEEAAKAAEWNQEEAELYTSEMQPVITKSLNTIKAAYAHIGAEAISNNFFYATYTVKERPAITLTLNPAAGSEVEDSTKVTVTASRELEEDEFIVFKMFATKEAADTCHDDVMINEGMIYGEPDEEDETIGYPVITKAAPVLKVGTLNGMDEEGNWIYNWVVAEYKVKAQGGDSTAIEGKELAGVSLYPNPTEGEFNVVAPAAAQVEIFNAAGMLVKRLVVAEGMAQVRLNNSGIYFVRVSANGQVAIKKVVVR